jgi:hypothetical protein
VPAQGALALVPALVLVLALVPRLVLALALVRVLARVLALRRVPALRLGRTRSMPDQGNPRATQKLDQPVSSFLVP